MFENIKHILFPPEFTKGKQFILEFITFLGFIVSLTDFLKDYKIFIVMITITISLVGWLIIILKSAYSTYTDYLQIIENREGLKEETTNNHEQIADLINRNEYLGQIISLILENIPREQKNKLLDTVKKEYEVRNGTFKNNKNNKFNKDSY